MTKPKHRWDRIGEVVCVIVLAALFVMQQRRAETPAEPVVDMAVDRDVAVVLRDGVTLRADVYRPRGPGKFPVLLFRTPYGKHYAADSYRIQRLAVERNYAVVFQDVRGRYASEGTFTPYRTEGADGFDTIEWAAGNRGPTARSARSGCRTRALCNGWQRWNSRRIWWPWFRR